MRVLVTGGTGFVGRHVVECLKQRGHFVVIGTRGVKHDGLVQFFMDDMRWMGNVLEKNEIECVIHLSGYASVGKSFSQQFDVFRDNVQTTINLLKVLESNPHIKLVLASSSEVYKPSNEILTEDSELGPVSPYGLSKMYVDCFSRMVARQKDLKWIVVRPFNTIGVGQSLGFVIPSFARQIVEMKLGKREKVLRVGNVNVSRDFVDVRDVAAAYVLLSESEDKSEVYNICSGKSNQLFDCIKMMIETTNLEGVSIETDDKLFRPVDVMNITGSSKKFFCRHGWMSVIPLETTLRDLLNYIEVEIKNEK